MAKASLDTTSYAWGKIASSWETYFTPPSRPSKGEVAKYKEWIKILAKGKKELKGLVLGATPELRDVLNEHNFKTYSIDINMEMILALEGLVKHKNPGEVLVKANWLENPLADNYFDVILGDAVIPNLPWENREQFYKEVTRMLKPKGYFINRAFFAPQIKRYKTIEEILTAFSKKKASNTSAIEFVFEVQLMTHTPKDRLGSMEKVKKVVEKLHTPKGFTYKSKELNKTLDIVWNYWLAGVPNKVWIYPSENEEEAEYKKYFTIEQKFSAKDHPYGNITPMYLLKLK